MQTNWLIETEQKLNRGHQLGDYTLLERIGVGGEGSVWSGWDNRRQRVVAVKVMSSPGDMSIYAPQISSEFERQVHLVASLEHAHILPLYEFGVSDEDTYFIMKYGCAGSLATRLMAGALPLEKVIRYAAQIASALEYLHQRGIIHRDLKPSNILLDGQEQTYLADFGLAKRLIQETAPLHTGRGTGPYAPIEQHMPGVLTPQSDIYSLGVLIYEMIAGKLPWGGTTDLATQQFQGMQELPDLQELNPQLPAGLSNVLRRMTAFEWAERPASAHEAFNLLVEAIPAKMQDEAIELYDSIPLLDDREQMENDARYLLGLFLPGWKPEIEAFPASLTNVAFIGAAFSVPGQDGQKQEESFSQFMLRGAFSHGYQLDYWWQQVTDRRLRFQVCEQTINNEPDEAVGRALAYLARNASDGLSRVGFSQETLDRLIDLAVGKKGWALRSNALKTLEQVTPESAGWRPVGISSDADAKLAALALEGSSHATRAAGLIGRLHSETAVKTIIDGAEDSKDRERFLEILKRVRAAAGGLPRMVPMQLRLQIVANEIWEQLLEDRQTLSWSRSLIGLLVGVLTSIMMLVGLFSRPDAQTRDALLEPYPVSDVVTIVEVNDESLELFGRWDDWPRTRHAELIGRLSAAGASVIVFDFIFDTETPQDEALADAMLSSGNVLLTVSGEGDAFRDATSTAQYERGVLPRSEFISAAAAVGHTNILHDEDGYVRRVPTIATIEGEQHLSLSLAALKLFVGDERNSIPQPAEGMLEIVGRQIPVGELGDMAVYYAGPPAGPRTNTFNTVSYQDVLNGSVPVDMFEGKVVLIGIAATAVPDRYLTPVSNGRPMYGVEILANVIESIWSGHFITRPAVALRVVILLLLGIVTGLLCTRPWSGLILAGGVAVGYFVVASWIFELRGVMLDVLFPFLSIAISYATVTAYRFSLEERRRREVMQLFQSRVTPDVARATIEAVKKGEISLGGRVQQVSVLLAETRGYRAFAEAHEPEEIMEAINALRDRFVEAVFAFEGTLAQYEGDQTMAIFNAPLPQPDHARRVVEAALAVQEGIEAYHNALPVGHPHRLLDYGYGAFTGRAIVGHSGSDGRFAYSAMGHAVTAASHLAKSAKPSQVVIGELTRQKAEDLASISPLPPVYVKDEPTPVPAYSVIKRSQLGIPKK